MFSAVYTQKNTRHKRSVRSRTISDYSPFGVLLPERSVNTEDFRYGFQGQEHDDEVKGEGNSVNFKYRMHDPRVGRFFAVDPLIKKYPYYSSYSFSGNRVIDACEIEGLEPSKADGWSKEKTPGADDHQVEFWSNNNGGLDTYYKPFQIKDLKEIKVTPNNAGSLIIQETGQSSNPLSGVSLSGVARGLSAPTSYMSNPWKDDITNHPEWQLTRSKCDNLEAGVVANLSIPLLLMGGFEFAPVMYSQLTGQLGATQQFAALYRLGNTAADATAQAIDISANGGSWNWGSTLGNLAFSNPFASAAPGTLNNVLNDNNVQENIWSHLGNYGFSVAGNYLSGKVGSINPSLMSGGMKHGLSGFGVPLMFNAAGTSLQFPIKE